MSPAGVICDEERPRDDPPRLRVADVGPPASDSADLVRTGDGALREAGVSPARVVAAVDRQRQMLERDLHDGVQQRLVAVRIGLGLVSELATGDASLREMLDEIGESVEAAIEELREVAHGIYPQVLSDHGLVAALRHVSRAAGGAVTVRGTGVSRHPAELESAIYYCCREAIQNASKHGGLSVQISISLHEDTRNVSFEVSDDGPGFDLAEASAGAGLQHMRDRVGSLGGCLSIVSPAGGGTVVSGAIPRR